MTRKQKLDFSNGKIFLFLALLIASPRSLFFDFWLLILLYDDEDDDEYDGEDEFDYEDDDEDEDYSDINATNWQILQSHTHMFLIKF